MRVITIRYIWCVHFYQYMMTSTLTLLVYGRWYILAADFEVVDRCLVVSGCYGISDSQSLASTESSASTEPWFCDACKAGVVPVSMSNFWTFVAWPASLQAHSSTGSVCGGPNPLIRLCHAAVSDPISCYGSGLKFMSPSDSVLSLIGVQHALFSSSTGHPISHEIMYRVWCTPP